MEGCESCVILRLGMRQSDLERDVVSTLVIYFIKHISLGSTAILTLSAFTLTVARWKTSSSTAAITNQY